LMLLVASEVHTQDPELPPEGPTPTIEALTEASTPVSASPAVYAHDDMAPTARAVRTDAPITIDGVLDEAVWMTAPVA